MPTWADRTRVTAPNTRTTPHRRSCQRSGVPSAVAGTSWRSTRPANSTPPDSHLNDARRDLGPGAISALTLRLLADDGAVVHVPHGRPAARRTVGTVGRDQEETHRITDVPASLQDRQRVRMRRYFWIMGTCLALIISAWTVVRLVSVPTAIVMSAVAAVLPPIAAMVANRHGGG